MHLFCVNHVCLYIVYILILRKAGDAVLNRILCSGRYYGVFHSDTMLLNRINDLLPEKSTDQGLLVERQIDALVLMNNQLLAAARDTVDLSSFN